MPEKWGGLLVSNLTPWCSEIFTYVYVHRNPDFRSHNKRMRMYFFCWDPLIQGRTNPAFSKPCLCLSDTRHFRHFRRFRGSEEQSPCFQRIECKFVIFAVFVKTPPFWQGTKTLALPALQKLFMDFLFEFAWEFWIEKRRGVLVNFFWSAVSTKRSTKNPRKIRGKFRAKSGAKFGTKIRKIRETFVLRLF